MSFLQKHLRTRFNAVVFCVGTLLMPASWANSDRPEHQIKVKGQKVRIFNVSANADMMDMIRKSDESKIAFADFDWANDNQIDLYTKYTDKRASNVVMHCRLSVDSYKTMRKLRSAVEKKIETGRVFMDTEQSNRLSLGLWFLDKFYDVDLRGVASRDFDDDKPVKQQIEQNNEQLNNGLVRRNKNDSCKTLKLH